MPYTADEVLNHLRTEYQYHKDAGEHILEMGNPATISLEDLQTARDHLTKAQGIASVCKHFHRDL